MGYIRELLQRGQIPGVLPAQLRAVDGREELVFDTADKRNLAEFWGSHRIGAEDLRALARAVVEVLRQCREHLLPPEGVFLEPERIYLDEKGGFSFTYRYGSAERGSALPLAKFLLARLDRADRAAVLAGYDFYQRAGEGAPVPEMFRQLVASCSETFPGDEQIHTSLPGKEGNFPIACLSPAEEERSRLLDELFSDRNEEEKKRRLPVRIEIRLKLWQQRILIGAGMVIAAAVVVGMAAGDAMIGAGCTLIAGAVAAYAWLRREKQKGRGTKGR